MTKPARARDRGGDRPKKAMLRSMLALSLVGAASALPVVPAEARRASTIDLVAPMRVAAGETLTIRGRHFSPVRKRNTVIFRAPSKLVTFAKPRRAFRRKLVLKVPGSVERLLDNEDGAGAGTPTRFTLRVIVRRRYGRRSARRHSPLIVSALRDGGPAECGNGSDFDRDLLANSLEASIKTDPCDADTDRDGVEDGFEYHSALDLNQNAIPYPGKRPFANPLDPADAQHDYDGDALSNSEEFRAWAHAPTNPAPSGLQFYTGDLGAPAFGGPYGSRPTFGAHVLPLNYSDGDQTSVEVTSGHPEYSSSLDHDSSGRLTDDERDVDGDGLGNVDEIRILMWQGHYPAGETCGYEYRPALPRVFLQVDYMETDTDGDGVWDGNDDQDDDGVSNADEVAPPYGSCLEVDPLPVDGARDGTPRLRHPYNPCLPYRSDTCARYGARD